MKTDHANIVVRNWEVISAIGIGKNEFEDGCRTKRSGLSLLTPAEPGEHAFEACCFIPGFDTRKFLSKKGTRLMDRTTGLATAATGMLLSHLEIDGETDPLDVGIVLGTHGSLKSITDFTRETLVQPKPFMVNPMEFPNTVMNCAAGQCAIWHDVHGPNTTLSAGRLSSILALKYAATLLRRGYARLIFAGGVQEYCPINGWGYFHTASPGLKAERPYGEGCAMFALQKASDLSGESGEGTADLVACDTGRYIPDLSAGPKERAGGVAECIRNVLAKGNVLPEQIWAVSLDQCNEDDMNRAERDGLALALKTAGISHTLTVGEQVGNCFNAAGAIQIAALMALFEREADGSNRYALAISLDEGGDVGSVLLKSRNS